MSRFLFIIFFLGLTGCHHSGLLVHQQNVNSNYLASTHIKSPDPRQHCPPLGKMVIIEWWVPKKILACDPKIVLDLVFWNFTKKIVEFPMKGRIGYCTYELLNEEFAKTKGILTYKVDIVTCDGQVFCEWKHQLWVNLIELGESKTPEAIE